MVETDAANPHFVSVRLPMGAEVEAVVEWPGHRDTLR